MESREKQIYRVTIVGSIANFFLLVFKFVAGTLGKSSAMIADAVHSLSDFVTDVIVLIFVKVSAKPKMRGMITGMVNMRHWQLQLSGLFC